MSTITPHDRAAWRARLLSTLKRVRYAPDPAAKSADFYVALGWISAAHCLGAISIVASEHLNDLALNASEQRAAEFTQQRRQASARERAA
ncbi:hypothetical protein L1F06_015705 [Ectopseudomonas hydrolytica]|uniref:Uncharacterized protein n=1 Tax=Ectopseudomonas hydrolytica TaxID=2493633 RepID=A0ABY5A2V4_9GAMM|nr:hypothetical protein [Pseudomonas hydrolytica]USR38115.1 hypothetical protein L1F06_015705 [Pseudomonas hydrolytica]